MRADTVIRNGKIVSPKGITSAGIAISNDKIVAIASDACLPEAERTIDAGGNHVLPGIIDVHVHIGLFRSFEDEMKDVAAAAFGGTTTVGNYLGHGVSAQRGSYEKVFHQWKETWERNSVVDAFFHGGTLSNMNIREIGTNAQRYGIMSYKFMMTCKGLECEQLGADPVDDGFLWSGFNAIAHLGSPARAMVHAENIDIIYQTEAPVKATGRQDLAAWAEARPGFCETLDVERAISIARVTGAPLYIVHTSYSDSVDVIAEAKAKGINIVGETCPQYLALTKFAPLGPLGRINPPLRDEACQDRLWQGIREGTIDCMGSDHCSTTREMKQDLWQALSGMPGLETLLPIMLSKGVNEGRITLEKLVEVLCYNNARIFGIYPKKGAIRVGSDADLVIVDLNKKVKLSASNAHYAIADYCPYEGLEVKGWPVLTMLRGNIVVEDGRMVAKPGLGRYIPRPTAR